MKPVDFQGLFKFEQRLKRQLAKTFGLMEDGSPRVEFVLVDRTRGYLPAFRAVPYSHECRKPEDFMRVLEAAMGNLNTAAERARTELGCFRRLWEEGLEHEMLRVRLARILKPPFTMEPNYAFLGFKPQDHYWALAGGRLERLQADPDPKHFKDLLTFVRKCRDALEQKHGHAIRGWAVAITDYGTSVYALVQRTKKEILDLKVQVEARRRVLKAEEEKVLEEIAKGATYDR